VMRPYFLGLFIEVLLDSGKLEKAEACLEKALELVSTTGECYYAAELLRLQGRVLMAKGVADLQSLAETCFEESIELAQRQGALIFELRAVKDLANFRQDRDEAMPDLDRLEKALSRCSEGAGTQDFQEARSVYQQLKKRFQQAGRDPSES